jgi:membrane protease subunit HflK
MSQHLQTPQSPPPWEQSPFNFKLDLSNVKFILIALLVLIGIITGSKSFYTIPAESQAVVIRFGQYLTTEDSGLRFKIPFMDEVILLPVKRQLKQEFGFSSDRGNYSRRARKSRRSQNYRQSNEYEQERNMVTGDLNAAQVEWIIQYRITQPRDFLFKVRNPQETLRDLSEASMREVIGDRTVDEVITIGRQEIEAQTLSKLQKSCNEYELGLYIDQVQLKNVNPPKPVQPSFNEVNQAQQEREKAINVANGEYNRAVPRARGEADQKLQAAEGYLDKRVNEAKGDAQRFNALLVEYVKAPEVTRQRLLLETLGQVLPNVKNTMIVDEDLKGMLPLLNLSPTSTK